MESYDNKSYTIILPAFNEELTIRSVIQSFYKVIPQAYFYVCNNNSTDNTFAVAEQTLKDLGCQGIVVNERIQGKASVVRKAFRELDADIYIMVDADMTYPADAIWSLIDPVLKEDVDMVVGNRQAQGIYAKQNRRIFHNIGNKLVNTLINFLFKAKLQDVFSGYRVFSRRFVQNTPILSRGFAIETELSLQCLDKGFCLKELPVNYVNRPQGSFSKLNTYIDGFNVLKFILLIFKNYRPGTFFGFFGIFFFLLSIIAATPVIDEFIRTQYIAHIPLTILATGLMITSLLAFAIALILTTVGALHRRDYELQMMRYYQRLTKTVKG